VILNLKLGTLPKIYRKLGVEWKLESKASSQGMAENIVVSFRGSGCEEVSSILLTRSLLHAVLIDIS
jgi:hypothetical protein